MKNVLKPLAKSNLVPLGLTAGASATDAAIHKKMFGSDRPLDLASRTKTLVVSNEEINDITKIVNFLEESGLLIKVLVKQFKMKQKNKNADFSVCY